MIVDHVISHLIEFFKASGKDGEVYCPSKGATKLIIKRFPKIPKTDVVIIFGSSANHYRYWTGSLSNTRSVQFSLSDPNILQTLEKVVLNYQ